MKLKRNDKTKIHKLVKDGEQCKLMRKIIGYYSKGWSSSNITEILSNDPRNKYRGNPISKSLICRIIRKFKIEQKSLQDSIRNLRL